MAAEVSLKPKLYKIELIVLKYLPCILALLGFISTICDYICVNSIIVNYIMVALFYSFLLISSFIFKFCIYHRLPIYYLIVTNILSIIDVYIRIPINNFWMLQVYLIVTFIFIILTIITYVKTNKKTSLQNNR